MAVGPRRQALSRLHTGLGSQLPGPQSRSDHQSTGRPVAQTDLARSRVLQRTFDAARPAHRRAQLLPARVLHQQWRGSQRRRDQAGAQMGREEQRRRLRNHYVRRFFSRPYAGNHVRFRQTAVPRSVRTESAGLSESETQRPRLGRKPDCRQDRGRHAGADSGRDRRHHCDGHVHARFARADAQARPVADRR